MDIQQAIVGILVLLAALYMGQHLWKSVHTKDGDVCGGCGGCGKPVAKPDGVRAAPQPTTLVTLSAPPQRRAKSRV